MEICISISMKFFHAQDKFLILNNGQNLYAKTWPKPMAKTCVLAKTFNMAKTSVRRNGLYIWPKLLAGQNS